MDSSHYTAYWVDKSHRILKVSSSWDDFARKNQGDLVVAEKVCGRLLWEFIQDDTTRMWVETLLNLARLQNKPIERPYRCDSPLERRYMQMVVMPHPDGTLEIRHNLLQIETRAKPINFRAVEWGRLANRLRCSVCGRIHWQKQWVEADVFIAQNPKQSKAIMVIYTVCEDCREYLFRTPKSQSPSVNE